MMIVFVGEQASGTEQGLLHHVSPARYSARAHRDQCVYIFTQSCGPVSINNITGLIAIASNINF